MKFLFKGYTLLIILVILSILSLFIGVSQLSITDLFHLSDNQKNILFSSRIPRTISILLSGSSLALAGLVMQQMMQNKFVSPTTAETMPPIIIPKSGTKITSFTFIKLISLTNKNVPPSLNATAKVNLINI